MKFFVTLATTIAWTEATLISIQNDVPRRDVDGLILNAHDGSVQFFGNTYFLYGTVYENCTQVRLRLHMS